MEKEIVMSGKMRQMWGHSETPKGCYDFFSSEFPSGVVDEKLAVKFFNRYLPGQGKAIVDLGIGSGRELNWMDDLDCLTKVFGIDYSEKMLAFCQKRSELYKHEVICVHDDLLDLKQFPKYKKEIKEPVVYLSLINSAGNFSSRERIQFLKQIKILLKQNDRLILFLYKRPSLKTEKILPQPMPDAVTPKRKIDGIYLNFIREYALIPYVWHSVFGKGEFPCFWYDKKSNDIVIHSEGKRIVISHRFNKKEIQDLAVCAGLNIEKIAVGKFMYMVVLRLNQ
jgi:hypothetical protein